MNHLEQLLKRASETSMSPQQKEAQRQSFAYGNTRFENERITRATIKRASEELSKENPINCD